MSAADGLLREGIHQIPLGEIYAEEQVRQIFNTSKLQELAADMKASGQAQAIMVRPKPSEHGMYLIVFGERRVRAARLLGWPDIRAEVRDIDDVKAARLQYSENQARIDLNPIDDARAIRRRMQAEGWNYVEAAAGLGRKENSLRERVKLLDLIRPMIQMLELEQIKVSFGVAMEKLNPEMQQVAFAFLTNRMKRHEVKIFQDYCNKLYMRQQQPSLLPLDMLEQGESPASYYSHSLQDEGEGEGESGGTDSVPPYSRHPYLPKLPRGKNVGIVLEKYIEQLKADDDPQRHEAARIVEHIYVELRAANKIKIKIKS